MGSFCPNIKKIRIISFLENPASQNPDVYLTPTCIPLQSFNTSTMYGCLDGYLVYGWCQNDHELRIDSKWLKENNVDEFVIDIVKNYAGEFIYGIPCDIDEETGVSTISKKEKKCVRKAHKKSGSKEKLVYCMGMRGDAYEAACKMTYNPDQPDTEEEVTEHTST